VMVLRKTAAASGARFFPCFSSPVCLPCYSSQDSCLGWTAGCPIKWWRQGTGNPRLSSTPKAWERLIKGIYFCVAGLFAIWR